ncbi:MAG TPA: PepSY-associated TM helix domain-containing protein, partial [Novosphingobium sp.]|nr:PepSY-associated TM helix domain-containing protein [Novosphingobium sp.]
TRHLTLAADGTPLAEGETRADALSDFLVELHQTLKADDKGGWAIGIGGAGLAVMLALGLVAVWPRRGRFVRALRPGPVASARVRPLAWHRALGLWAAAPALLMATTGTAMVFDDGFRALLGGARPDHASHPGPVRVDLAAALATALAAAPGSRLTAIIGMPTAADATYRFRLLAPGEWRRAYGTSMVDIDAGTGAVALLYTPATATFGQRLADSLYALHTGEVAGWPGRLLVTATGLWLVVMIALGFASWWRRRGQAS